MELDSSERKQMSQFLAEHLGRVEPDDVGPMLGQVAQFSEASHSDPGYWLAMSETVNRALSC